jgi:hypothetical protein
MALNGSGPSQRIVLRGEIVCREFHPSPSGIGMVAHAYSSGAG